jgi:hypothetical protein
VGGAGIPNKKSIKKKNYLKKNPKSKIYYAMWTLRIEVVNGKKIFIIVFSEFIL